MRVYRRLGVSSNADWTSKAAGAVFDSLQASRLPDLDESLEHADISEADLEKAIEVVLAGRAPPVLEAAPAASIRVLPPRQVPGAWSAGDYALVPATVWPSYRCGEFRGRGWLARVLRVAGRGDEQRALLRFEDARTRAGKRFEDVSLYVGVLVDVPDA